MLSATIPVSCRYVVPYPKFEKGRPFRIERLDDEPACCCCACACLVSIVIDMQTSLTTTIIIGATS